MADLRLPPAMAALRTDLADSVAAVEERLPYGAALLSAKHELSINVNDREEQVVEPPAIAGAVISAFDGATMHEAAIGGIDRAGVLRAARDLVHSLRPAAHRHAIDPGPARHGDFVTPMTIAPEALSTAEKLDRCRALHRHVRDLDTRIVNVQVHYAETSELSVFANRMADLAQRVQRVRLTLLVAVADKSGVRYDWTSKDATGGWEQLEYTDDELRSLVESAVALLGAERIEPGEYTIITAPGVAGTICHESFGHGVETDMFLKQRAKAAHFIDKVVGSPLVNIWDDPSAPSAYGGYFFDDEGMLAVPTQIVENGVFRRGITDLYSATALGVARSANGRRQDWSRKVYARMSATFFAAGATPVADLFAQVDRGIYLAKWSSGMEDPQGWGIQVTCHFGYEIKGGKLTNRVFAPIGVSGYVPDVLQSISAIGDDLSLDGGGCGKGHKEQVPVSSGGPHMLLKARLG
jgi:TldD protein